MPFMTAQEPYQRPTPLKGPLKTRAEARVKYGEIVAELHDITDEDTLALYLATISEPLLQFEEELSYWWEGDGKDFAGLDNEIRKAWRRVTAEW